jgi:hypothetical protein
VTVTCVQRDHPELTTLIPADPRVPELPQGGLYIGRRDGQIWIDHADPRVLIGLSLLGCIAVGPVQGVTLTLRKDAEPGCCKYIGAVLRIEAANQTLVYRVTECVPWYDGYIAEWPD